MKLNSHDRKLRLLFLIGELGLGGSERQLYLLLKYLRREWFECHVVVFNRSGHFVFNNSLEAIGVRVSAVPKTCRSIAARMLFLYRLFRNEHPDVVHSWTVHDNPYATIVGLIANVPLRLGSVRGSLQSPGMSKLPAIYRYLSLKGSSHLVVNSDSIRKELTDYGYSASRITVLPNCVEIPSEASEPKRESDLANLGLNPAHRIIGVVGNLRPEKNHLMFVKGIAKILLRHPTVQGLIVGQPLPAHAEIYDQLKAEIKKVGLTDRIIVTGFRNDVPMLMRSLSIVCHTSVSEGMPNVILEAMAAARPVIATRVGGVSEVIEHGVNGLLVNPGDVADFSRAVGQLLEEPEYAKSLGRAGQQLVSERFGCRLRADDLSRLYFELLGEKYMKKILGKFELMGAHE